MFRSRLTSVTWRTIFLLLLGAAHSTHAADFLVIENVGQLSIHNKYQQEASGTERALFAPYVPMRIIQPNDMLGDGFTPCMQVEVGGQPFYLLKEKNGDLSRGGSLGYQKVFSNVNVLLDTVQALTDKTILLSPINGRARYVAPGDLLVRIFSHRHLTYCQILNAPPAFGWIDFGGRTEKRDWMTLMRPPSASVSITSVSSKIRIRVEEVNRTLTRLFGFFNSQTSQQRPTPAWTIETSRSTITCSLQGAAHAEQFEQSTFYLMNEIENIALGSEFEVIRSPGRIEIRSK